jgi:hypothetical protein
MKIPIPAFILLVLSHAWTASSAGSAAPRGSDEGLRIAADWSICLPPSPHRALVRAASDLQGFINSRHGLELKITETSAAKGILLAVSQPAQPDRFSVRADPASRQFRIEGSSPLAVYQGVLLLEDRLAERPSLRSNFAETVVYPFKDRFLIWDALLTGQNKGALGFNLESHVREAVRLGYTGMECNRFVGMKLLQQGNPGDPYPWYTYWGPSMDQFVSSPLFEGVFPADYLARNLADLKRVSETVASFGLKPIFTGYEPRFVPEMFLQRRPDLRGPRVDHPLRSMTPRYSLCTDVPEVLEHYRALARKLATEVPAIAEVRVIFHDSGAGLCWEDGLYSGRNGPERCRNVAVGERMRRFFLAIKDGWREGGRDIPVVAQPHSTSRRELDAFLDTVPKDIGLTAGNWASWSLAYHDPLSVDLHVLARQRETGRRTIYFQQHFFGFDGAPTSEFPLPFRLAARLERARGMGLDELDTLGGFVSPPVKQRSVMQELYRRFLLEPGTGPDQLVERTAAELGGTDAGPVLVSIWKDIDSAIEQNGNQIGFALGTEYASRRTLVRPLVPDASALSPDERDWWLRFTFGGSLRFGHAHLFRAEGGLPPQDFYVTSRDRSIRARDAFQRGSAALRIYIGAHSDAVRLHPYLAAHERQLRFLSSVYATGANLCEGQRILDRYSRKSIEDDLKREVDSDIELFRRTVQNEIENMQALLELFEQDGDPGMVLLSEETTWGYGANFPDLLRRKIEIMTRRLPEIGAVLRRWFDSEY